MKKYSVFFYMAMLIASGISEFFFLTSVDNPHSVSLKTVDGLRRNSDGNRKRRYLATFTDTIQAKALQTTI